MRVAVSLCLLLMLLAVPVLFAQAPPDPNSPKEQQKRWRRVLFWKQRTRLLALRQKEGSFLAAIEAMDRENMALLQRITALEKRQQALAKEVQSSHRAWRQQQTLSLAMLAKLQPRLRMFYRFVRLGRARLLMGARNLNQLALRWRALHLTTVHDLKTLKTFQQVRHLARAKAKKWKQKQAEHRALLKKIRGRQRELVVRRRNKALALQAIYREVHLYRQYLQELRGSGGKLQRMLRKWQKKTPSGGLAMLKGSLPWPIHKFSDRCALYKLKSEGSFRALYCAKKSARRLSLSDEQRPGVVLAVPAGTPVLAVAAGKVAHRGFIRGYGQVVLLDHGQNFFSLYAHLSHITLSQGQVVRVGHSVGLSGATGILGAPRLYLELRHHSRVLPTRAWLSPLP